jgi:hypothetical protein
MYRSYKKRPKIHRSPDSDPPPALSHPKITSSFDWSAIPVRPALSTSSSNPRLHQRHQHQDKMASHQDVETGPAADERAPLLGQQRSESANASSSQDENIPKPQSEASKRRAYGWRGFWIVVGILIIAAFVKGWIEADDVDVSCLDNLRSAQMNESDHVLQFDLKGALMRALGGGLSGAAAMVLQVLLLMPIRTIMNYQYRHGTSLTVATKTLYQDGGYGRYYAGMGAALFQGKSSCYKSCLLNLQD